MSNRSISKLPKKTNKRLLKVKTTENHLSAEYLSNNDSQGKLKTLNSISDKDSINKFPFILKDLKKKKKVILDSLI